MLGHMTFDILPQFIQARDKSANLSHFCSRGVSAPDESDPIVTRMTKIKTDHFQITKITSENYASEV